MHSGRRTVNQPPQACETEASIQTFQRGSCTKSADFCFWQSLPVISVWPCHHEWVLQLAGFVDLVIVLEPDVMRLSGISWA